MRRKLLFSLLPVVVLLLASEVAVRVFRARQGLSPFMVGSYRDQRIDLIRRGYPSAHDPLLGYVPRANVASDRNRWGVLVSIDEQQLRRNGPGPRPTGGPGVLAVGDSFTFGDQVADAETWPARLEQRLQRPVWNGGVFGYSFAQTVLRAEQLLPRLAPAELVVALIADDLRRCELSKRFTPVPWYDLVGDELVLKNVPVPDSARDNALDRQWGRRLLGHSALLDVLFWNAIPQWWVADQREVRAHPPGTGVKIGDRLLERLAATCRQRQVRLLVVLQGWAVDADGRAFVEHAQAAGIEVVDLVTRFVALAQRDPAAAAFFDGHMTAAGNDWVAAQIADVLRAK